MSFEFRCAICNKIYTSYVMPDEADAECNRIFGIKDGTKLINFATQYVCDECFQLIRPDKEFVRN